MLLFDLIRHLVNRANEQTHGHGQGTSDYQRGEGSGEGKKMNNKK